MLNDENTGSSIFRAQDDTSASDVDSLGLTRGCNLYVLKVMDYETDPQVYNVTLRAIDAGGLTASVAVCITDFWVKKPYPSHSLFPVA